MGKYLLSVFFFLAISLQAQWTKLNTGIWWAKPIDMSFFSDSVGFMVFEGTLPQTQGFSVEKTVDYGVNWSSKHGKPPASSKKPQVFCFESDTVFCVDQYSGISTIDISNDGGQNWNLYKCCISPGIETFHFLNPFYGVKGDLSGGIERFYKNSTFSVNPFPLSSSVYDVFVTSYKDIFSIVNKKTLYQSADSGYNWSSILTSSFDMNKIYFSTNNIGYVACDSGKILKTVNGGATWIVQNTSILKKLNSIHFKNDTVGFCVGETGTVLFTKNGGNTWVQEPLGCLTNLIKVITTGKKAYILSSDGNIFRRDIDTCDKVIKPIISINTPGTMCEPGYNNLAGSPTGGIYLSSTGYNNSIPPGIHTLGYYYTDINTGCSSIANATITVLPKPVLTLTAPNNTLCVNTGTNNMATTTLVGNPAGGSYIPFGPVISVPAVGTYSFTYDYTDPNGCNNKKGITIKAFYNPDIIFSLSDNTTCTSITNGSPISLSASPSGGSFSGTGVSGAIFNPPSTSGTYPIIYSVTDPTTSCSNQDTLNIIVNDCVGIKEEVFIERVNILPNPNNGIFEINATVQLYVSIRDVLGKVILELNPDESKNKIDLSNKANGIYFVIVKNLEGNQKTFRIIKL